MPVTTGSKTAAVVLASIALATASACSSSSKNNSSAPGGSSPSSAPSTSASGSSSASAPFGPACSSVPASGPGSFNGMATAPVATAASANPVLSTLVTAVGKAGLGDTLNSAQGITVFAPTNSAFSKIPAATLSGVLANKPELTKILTFHVVSGRLTPEQLAGGHKTLEGGTVNVAGSGQSFTVDGANVVCGDVQTANATVYIIDGVLMPSS